MGQKMKSDNLCKINNKAEQFAEEVFALTGNIIPSIKSLIVWVENTFEKKIRIDFIKLSGCSGMEYYDPETNGFQIKINSDESENRQRFTICHEIGHIINNMSEICGYSTGDIYTAHGKERFCDRFAAAYLMPQKLFSYKWQSLGNKELVQIKKARMAKFFNVSVDTVNYRAKELNLISW